MALDGAEIDPGGVADEHEHARPHRRAESVEEQESPKRHAIRAGERRERHARAHDEPAEHHRGAPRGIAIPQAQPVEDAVAAEPAHAVTDGIPDERGDHGDGETEHRIEVAPADQAPERQENQLAGKGQARAVQQDGDEHDRVSVGHQEVRD